jgi:hypothetical protein
MSIAGTCPTCRAGALMSVVRGRADLCGYVSALPSLPHFLKQCLSYALRSDQAAPDVLLVLGKLRLNVHPERSAGLEGLNARTDIATHKAMTRGFLRQTNGSRFCKIFP